MNFRQRQIPRPPADPAPVPLGPTLGQRWRKRRDLVIYLAHRAGCPQWILADVFDLAPSRVSMILRERRSSRSDPPL